MNDRDAELRALLTMAAAAEARRQGARTDAERIAAERELQKIEGRYRELEARHGPLDAR